MRTSDGGLQSAVYRLKRAAGGVLPPDIQAPVSELIEVAHEVVEAVRDGVEVTIEGAAPGGAFAVSKRTS